MKRFHRIAATLIAFAENHFRFAEVVPQPFQGSWPFFDRLPRVARSGPDWHPRNPGLIDGIPSGYSGQPEITFGSYAKRSSEDGSAVAELGIGGRLCERSRMTIRLIRALLAVLLVAMPSSFAADRAATRGVAVGAIRWDAWHGDASEVGRAVQKSLAPKRWQERLPFFAEVAKDGAVTIAGDTDAVMTREIAYAQAAGLEYWAFLAYDAESPMSRALKRYLANPACANMHFCMIVDAGHWRPGNFEAEAARCAELMARPNYQTVLHGRPLFYVLNLALESNEAAWAQAGGFRKAVEGLRTAARARGLPEPYCVAMLPWPDKAKAFAEASGCDAISAYAVQAGGKGTPFADLTAYVEDFWKRSLETGAKVVPLAMTGWDRRPRVENPVFWEHNEGWGADMERFYQGAKPAEIGNHVRKAVEWTRAHPTCAEAQAVIIYAWNEHDEGGWLCPTRGEGDARIQAVGSALAQP